MTCYNPKPATMNWYRKINEKTGEVYWTKKANLLKPWEEFDPLGKKITLIPCGKCPGCAMDKSSDWATRCYLEAQNWPKNCFLTLTYDNDHIPKNRSLNKRDFQLFWKKLRKEQKEPIRYLMCGEYGPKTLRCHGHAAVFNYIPTDLKEYKPNEVGDMLYTSKRLNKIWGNGYVIVGRLTYESAAYIARYVVKKAYGMDKNWNLKHHREPEFILSSRKGGIGINAFRNEKLWTSIKRNNGVLIKTRDGVKLKKIPQFLRNKWKDLDNREEYYKVSDEHAERMKQKAREKMKTTDLTYWKYSKMLQKLQEDRIKKLKRTKGELTK